MSDDVGRLTTALASLSLTVAERPVAQWKPLSPAVPSVLWVGVCSASPRQLT